MLNRRKLYHFAYSGSSSSANITKARNIESSFRIWCENQSYVGPFIIKSFSFRIPHSHERVKASSRQQRSALQPSQIQLIYHSFVWTVFPHIFTSFFAAKTP